MYYYGYYMIILNNIIKRFIKILFILFKIFMVLVDNKHGLLSKLLKLILFLLKKYKFIWKNGVNTTPKCMII